MDDITNNTRSEEIVVYDGRKLKLIIFPGQIKTVSRPFTYLMNSFIRVLTLSFLNLEDLKHPSRYSTRPVLKLMKIYFFTVPMIFGLYTIQTLRL